MKNNAMSTWCHLVNEQTASVDFEVIMTGQYSIMLGHSDYPFVHEKLKST